MNTPYTIFLITFLAFPILAIIITPKMNHKWLSPLLKRALLFFVVHNLLFFFGFSVKGDYFDYFIFSVEWLSFCLAVCSISKTSGTFVKKFHFIGSVVMGLGFLVGFFGIFLFEVVSQDYKSDKIIHFTSNENYYETRRYSVGFVTTDTRYTFETYRSYKYLPFEKKIDKTDFIDTKTALVISEESLKISILNTGNKSKLLFQSTNGHSYLKPLN